MAEAKIDIVIGADKAQAGAAAVRSSVDGIKASFLELSAKVFVFEQAVTRAWGAATRGAQFEESLQRLNYQMAQNHSTAQLMINDLVRISNGQLSVRQATDIASRGLAAGMNPDQIKTFTDAAEQMGDVLGIEIPEAFQRITQAVATGRGQLLAQVGIYVDLDDEVKKYAASVGKVVDQVTRQERAMLAAKIITENAGNSMRKMADGARSDADRLKEVEAKWDNFWLKIERGAKSALVAVIEFGEKSPKWIQAPGSGVYSNDQIMEQVARNLGDKSTMQNDDVWQQILGRAIVSDTQGNAARMAADARNKRTPPVLLPFELRAKQADAAHELVMKGLQEDFEMTKRGSDAFARFMETDTQRGLFSQEQLVEGKKRLRERDLEAEGLMLIRQREEEAKYHKQILGMEGLTTEAKIAENIRYAEKVAEINSGIKKHADETIIAGIEAEQARDVAREEAEQARGERIQESLNAEYKMREDMRKRDFDDNQAYIQGQIDLAHSQFAGDQEIASKERELLRAQLAYKLKLSDEWVQRLLFMQKLGDQEGIDSILERADATLSMSARRGISMTGAAKDTELAERANGDFFAGWQRGLQKYAENTENVFGFAQDQARRTAQVMEQSFQQFFFAPMDGQFKSFADSFAGVLTVVKQIVAQIMAQFVTIGIVKPGASALQGLFGGMFSSGGPEAATLPGQPEFARFGGVLPTRRFGLGGVGGGGPQMAIFNEGAQREAFVPLPDGRTIPVTMKHEGAMLMPSQTTMPMVNVPVNVQVFNQMPGAKVETKQERGPDGMHMLRIFVRQELKSAVRDGAIDQEMERYGTSPQAGRR